MESSQDFKSLQDKIQAALVATTKRVNLIASQDIAFRRSLDPDAGEQLDEQRTKLLDLASALVKTAANQSLQTANAKALSLEDADDVEIHWRSIVDALDIALEKADTSIDEYSGLVKRKDAPAQDMSQAPQSKKFKSGPLDRPLRYANIVKPQRAFEVQPNNHDQGPWKPILAKKPHAIVPLEDSLGTFVDENEDTQYKNPYETEVLRMKYPDSVYQIRDPIPFQPMEKSAVIYVDTFEGVLQMLDELKKAKEIAVDLEHHDFRSYHGLLSLMQISTRDKDWVVDTLKPWRRRLEVLNEVFADPSIVKVFHGAYMDIKWLQRDLGLYVVGLFDTFSAAEALRYPGKGLAYLLSKFANFEADKRYQMADWRIRPLPEEMLYYARSDTHFLLYVFDMMRNELVRASVRGDPARDLIEITLQNSKHTALSRHEPYTVDHETGQGSRGWFNILTRSGARFTREQFSVFREVHRWRDDLARHHDESPHFMLSQAVLLDIASAMPLSVADLTWRLKQVPHTVKAAAQDLLATVTDAVKKGPNGPSVSDVLKADQGDETGRFAKMSLKGASGTGPNPAVAGSDEAIPSAADMKSKESQLWGKIPLSSFWDRVSEATGGSNVVNDQPIAVPWSSFVANAQVAIEHAVEQMQVDDPADGGGVAEDGLEAPPPPPNEEFTLKGGRSGAADADADDSSTSSDSDSGDDGAALDGEKTIPTKLTKRERHLRLKEEQRQRKLKRREEKAARRSIGEEKAASKGEKKAIGEGKPRKAEKKAIREHNLAARAARKALKQAARKPSASEGVEEDGVEEHGEEEVAFHYSTAPSVLHGQKPKESAGGGSKAYNPYAAKTSAEGPKPARRMNFEKVGKSATFKK